MDKQIAEQYRQSNADDPSRNVDDAIRNQTMALRREREAQGFRETELVPTSGLPGSGAQGRVGSQAGWASTAGSTEPPSSSSLGTRPGFGGLADTAPGDSSWRL